MTPLLRLEAVDVGTGETPGPLSLEVCPSEAVFLVGARPPALSAAIRVALGMRSPDAGGVRLLGSDPRALSPADLRALRARCGALLDRGVLVSNLSVEENLGLALRYHGRQAEGEVVRTVDEAIERNGIGALRSLRPALLDPTQRRLVALVRACLGDPELLLLDDPHGDLESSFRARVCEILAPAVRRGSGALITAPMPRGEGGLESLLADLPSARVVEWGSA